MKVLVAEDDRYTREGLVEVLEAEGDCGRGWHGCDSTVQGAGSRLCVSGYHDARPLDRNVIFRHGWGEDYFPNSRTLDQHISQLRKRIEPDSKHPTLIQTVHGVGYRYDPITDCDQS